MARINEIDRKALFTNLKRVVIKIGTRVLTSRDNRIDERRIRRIAREIAQIHKQGIETVIVSSGSVGLGMGALGIRERPRQVPRLQATAAVDNLNISRHGHVSYSKEQ